MNTTEIVTRFLDAYDKQPAGLNTEARIAGVLTTALGDWLHTSKELQAAYEQGFNDDVHEWRMMP